MPRVVIEKDGDVRLARGHVKPFKASPDVLVVSEREAEIIKANGLGREVARDDKAITAKKRAADTPTKPETPEA